MAQYGPKIGGHGASPMLTQRQLGMLFGAKKGISSLSARDHLFEYREGAEYYWRAH